MSCIITYKEGRYSQIKLDSGERILLSVAQPGIVIFKLRFWGLVPGLKIAEWSPADLARFVLLFGGAPQNQTPFKYVVERLSSFESIASLRQFLKKEPSAFDLARQEHTIKQMRDGMENERSEKNTSRSKKLEEFDFSNKPFTKALCLRAVEYHDEAINDLKESLGSIRPIKENNTINELVASCAITISMHIVHEASQNIGFDASFLPSQQIPKDAPIIIAFSIFLLSGIQDPLEAEGINLDFRELIADLATLFFMFHPDEERAKNALNGIETFQFIVNADDDKVKKWNQDLIKLLDIYILQWTSDKKEMKEIDCIPLFGGLLSALLKSIE